MAPRLPHARVLSAGVLRIALALAFVCALAFPASAEAAMIPPSDPAPVTPLFDLKDVRVSPGVRLPQRAAAIASGDNRIDALVSGATLDMDGQAATIKTITYSFYEDDVFHGVYGGGETGVREVSEGVKTNVRSILSWYSSIINVNFVEVAETATTAGTLRFMLSDVSDDLSYAYAYLPMTNHPFDVSSDVHLAPHRDNSDAADTNSFQNTAGTHGYMSLAHEIGHAVGLKHPFAGGAVLPTLEDNTANTIMSYTFAGDSAATPMAYDVAALQRMYGARAKNTGNDTYAFTSRGTDQYTQGSSTWQVTSRRVKQSIWDAAGFDTIDASALPYSSSGYRYNKDGSGWIVDGSHEFEVSGTNLRHYFRTGSSLAFDFAPEKFVNSSSNDRFTANSSANTFAGYTAGRSVGDDFIFGATAADKLDLTAYLEASVSKTTSGTDLILGLGLAGSVTLVDYYGANTPAIAYFGTPPNQPPMPRISVSATYGVAPLAVSFNSSTSTDSDGSIQYRRWDFSDGSSVLGATASKTYGTAGSYIATLTVTDNDGVSATTTTTISVIPAMGSLVGTVTSGGQPLADATVAVAGLTATTNSLGAYSLASIPASTYPVTFSKSGYTSQSATVTISHAQVTASSASLVHEIGALSGTVRFGATPVGGVSVTVAGKATTTAADGSYSISSIPKGSHAATYAKSGVYISQTSTVMISTGATTTKNVYLVHEMGTLSGTVTSGGQPLSGVRVNVLGKSGTTNSLGVYAITLVNTGSYVATYTMSGYTTQTQAAVINANQTTTIHIAMVRQTGALSGTVISGGIPLPEVRVSVAGLTATTTTSADGTYSIASIPAGAYEVSYSKDGYLTQTDSVTVYAGLSTARTVYLVRESGSLAGMTTAGGLPLSGVTVSVAGLTTISAANGAYSIAVPVGTHLASYAKSGYVTQSVSVVITPSGLSASADLLKLVTKASVVRSPAKSTATYTRKAGVARFTLSAVIRGWGARPVASRYVYLQTSKNGTTWSNTYKLKTSSVGKASKALAVQTKQVRYYRWYVPASAGVNLSTNAASTRVTVK